VYFNVYDVLKSYIYFFLKIANQNCDNPLRFPLYVSFIQERKKMKETRSRRSILSLRLPSKCKVT